MSTSTPPREGSAQQALHRHGPVVQTTAGRVRGLERDGLFIFDGISYAAPPVGPRRFAAPLPPVPWDGVRDATVGGACAPQQPSVLAPGIDLSCVGPDYLTASVISPALGSSRLPVLVWIHGGGFVAGSNRDPSTRGEALARQGIVVISLNYRLGIDGFLVLRDAVPNRGVLDWIAGLEWVRANAEAFGGDSSRITVAGHSAGSAAALILLAAGHQRPHIDRVVAMSGVPWRLQSLDEAHELTDGLCRHLGTEPTIEGLSEVPSDLVVASHDQLAPVSAEQATPAETFEALSERRPAFAPVIDGGLIAADPVNAIVAGEGAGIPLLAGSTRHEVDALVRFHPGACAGPDVRDTLLRQGFMASGVEQWVRYCGGDGKDALGSALTALKFRLPLLRLATRPEPTYLYEFTWAPTPIGAVHGLDVPLFFGNPDSPLALTAGGMPVPSGLMESMTAALADFVATGNPGWAQYQPDAPEVMHFSARAQVAVTSGHDLAVRRLLGP